MVQFRLSVVAEELEVDEDDIEPVCPAAVPTNRLNGTSTILATAPAAKTPAPIFKKFLREVFEVFSLSPLLMMNGQRRPNSHIRI